MPIVTNAITGLSTVSNYTFTNCKISSIAGSNIIYQTVPVGMLNASGFICTISYNFPWFWTAFLITLYMILFFLFSYLNSIKLIVVSSAGLFVMSTILIGYGLIGSGIWMASLAILIFSVLFMYFGHRG